MNEETFKNNVIIPLLVDLGFDASELEFETRFVIQLGRGTHEIKPAEGRLDILCRSADRNLLVAELKAPDESLGDQDRRQALSYARLVEPMAPYVLVSNGKTSRLYDTFTGNLVDRGAPTSGISHGLDEDIRLRYEALKSFVSYSLANLVAFTQAQRAAALRLFGASPEDPITRQLERKYIPDLYIGRQPIEDAFARFIKSKDAVFSIIGESGTGKTTLLCHLVQTVRIPALFYSGSLLGPALLEEICRDFGLAFSADLSELAVLKKVAALVRAHNTRLIIFLDAVDEWIAKDRSQQLGRIAEVSAQLGLQLCVSCKTSHWLELLTTRGVPTVFSQHLSAVSTLEDFDETELSTALKRSSQMLGLLTIGNIIPPDLHHPFTLRIALEIAHATGASVSECVDARRALARFIEVSITKTSQPDLYRRVVRETARHMLVLGVAQISMDVLRASIGLSILEDLPLEVFASGILYRHVDTTGVVHVGFYHSTLRHFVVACWIVQLDRLPSTERRAWLSSRFANIIAFDAALYFVRSGNTDEQIDAIQAAIEHDRSTGNRVTSRLLAWCRTRLKAETVARIGSAIEQHLVNTFEGIAVSEVEGNQIVSAMTSLSAVIPIECTLVRMFEHIARHPNPGLEFQASRLAALLRDGFDTNATSRLIAIARDRKVSGYVRRYAIESLDERVFDNRKEIFLELLLDEDLNVTHWVRKWYLRLETPELRDALLRLIDETPNKPRTKEICLTLESSALEDTPAALLARTSLVTSPQILSWLYRSLAGMGYREAIPEMLRHLRENPFSELSEHLFIAFGELATPEVIPIIVSLIDAEAIRISNSLFMSWMAMAFARCASDSDLAHVWRWLGEGPEKVSIVASIAGDLNHTELRAEVLRKLGRGELGTFGDNVLMTLNLNPRELGDSERDSLYAFAEFGSRCAMEALFMAGAAERNLTRLRDVSKRVVKRWRISDWWENKVPTRWWNSAQRKAISRLLDPWLAEELRALTDQDLMMSLIVFAGTVGGPRTLEIIRENHDRFVRTTNSDLIDKVQHEIQCSIILGEASNQE